MWRASVGVEYKLLALKSRAGIYSNFHVIVTRSDWISQWAGFSKITRRNSLGIHLANALSIQMDLHISYFLTEKFKNNERTKNEHLTYF